MTCVGTRQLSQADPFPEAPVSPICQTQPLEVTATVKLRPAAMLTTALEPRPSVTLHWEID